MLFLLPLVCILLFDYYYEHFIHQRVMEKKNKQKTTCNKHQDTIDMQDNQAVPCV